MDNRKRRILVADDDPFIRKMLGYILAKADYDVIYAEDGNSVIEKASTEKPDLVLLDGLMPKTHGFLACKAIKELDDAPKVILLTGVYTRLDYKWKVKETYAADDVMTKPFEVPALLASIEQQLSNATPRNVDRELAEGMEA